MREEFEKLPEIAKKIEYDDVWWSEKYNSYRGSDVELDCYANGAWYAYQEQQKKISVKDELKELYRKEVDFLRNQTSKAILALYSENKEDALNILKESIKE